jgi:O-antigen ligase
LNKNLILSLFSIIIIFLLFDSFFQFFVGENIFGQKLFDYRVSSFFGDDLILGSYLVRLLPIIFWYLFYLKIDVNLNRVYFTTFFSIYFIAIYLSGERTAFLLFLGLILLSLIFISELRHILLRSTLILSIFMILLAIFNFGKTDITHRMFNKTYKQVIKQSIIQENKIEKKNNFVSTFKAIRVFSNDHQGHYVLAKNLFIENPVFGVGPKGFRQFCRDVNYNPEEGICSTHPHNILAQTLSELGLIGILFYLIFVIFLIKYSLIAGAKKINNLNSSSFLIISIGLIIHLFPLLPSGNFFNNWISSFIYFKIGLLLYSYKKLFSK